MVNIIYFYIFHEIFIFFMRFSGEKYLVTFSNALFQLDKIFLIIYYFFRKQMATCWPIFCRTCTQIQLEYILLTSVTVIIYIFSNHRSNIKTTICLNTHYK